MPRIDTDLVVAARLGDREAFGQLYNRFAPMVHGIPLARVPRPDGAPKVRKSGAQVRPRRSRPAPAHPCRIRGLQ